LDKPDLIWYIYLEQRGPITRQRQNWTRTHLEQLRLEVRILRRHLIGKLKVLALAIVALVALATAYPLEGRASDRQELSASGLSPQVWLPLVSKQWSPGLGASPLSRKGVGLACDTTPWQEVADATGADWFYDWSVSSARADEAGEKYVPMVRTKYGNLDSATAFAAAYPGSYWLVGNEPNHVGEDNLAPDEAARAYSGLCAAILDVDPSAKCIVGGVLNETEYMGEMLAYWPSTVPIAGLHWHHYGWSSAATDTSLLRQRVDSYVAFTQAHDSNWEVWLTEFGVIWTGTENIPQNDVVDFIVGAVNYLGAKEGLTRYSWFAWQKCPWQDFPVAELIHPPYAEAYKSAAGG